MTIKLDKKANFFATNIIFKGQTILLVNFSHHNGTHINTGNEINTEIHWELFLLHSRTNSIFITALISFAVSTYSTVHYAFFI